MRFMGGKGSAPSLTPSSFRKWEPSPCLTLSGGCLSLHWQAWRDRGADPWVVEVLRDGYRFPFLRPHLSMDPIPMPSYAPTFIKGAALEEVTLALIAKGAVEHAPLPSPGFSSRLFVVWKTSGSWRPVIDLSLLIRFVDISHFRMETIPSVLMSVRQGDWVASIDLREAYLQVPGHPESHRFLRFVAHGRTYQFIALRFGLSTAPLVFTRVMAPVSVVLHSWGIRMRRYLDDWLIQALSREALLRDLGVVLSFCRELGIVVNPEKSDFSPSQVVQYLGVVIDFSAMVHPSPGVGEASGVSLVPPHPHRPVLASASLVCGPPPVVGGSASDSFSASRPPLPASVSSTLPGSPQAGPSCLETVQRFTRVAGFSSEVAAQASLARRPSSRSNYQLKWSVYRSWCHSQGHSISWPSLSKVADFLWWLRSIWGLKCLLHQVL